MKIMHQVRDFLDSCKQTIQKILVKSFKKPNERFLKKESQKIREQAVKIVEKRLKKRGMKLSDFNEEELKIMFEAEEKRLLEQIQTKHFKEVWEKGDNEQGK